MEKGITRKEVTQSLLTLQKIQMFLPEYSYRYEMEKSDSPIPIESSSVNIYNPDEYIYDEENNAQFYIGPSFLFYKPYNSDEEVANFVDTAKEDLRAGDFTAIRQVMQDYIDLEQKNNLRSQFTTDQWISRINMSPHFPANVKDNYYSKNKNSHKFKLDNHSKLTKYYNNINRSYDSGIGLPGLSNLFILYAALGISLLLLTIRLSTGRSFIYAILALFIISIGISIFTGIIAIGSGNVAALVYPLFFLGLFFSIIISIKSKISDGSRKGKSVIYFHIGIWSIPMLMFFVLWILAYLEIDFKDTYYYISWANILIVIIAMYPTCKFLRLWKALPEQ